MHPPVHVDAYAVHELLSRVVLKPYPGEKEITHLAPLVIADEHVPVAKYE
jgi:hypothetical protein